MYLQLQTDMASYWIADFSACYCDSSSHLYTVSHKNKNFESWSILDWVLINSVWLFLCLTVHILCTALLILLSNLVDVCVDFCRALWVLCILLCYEFVLVKMNHLLAVHFSSLTVLTVHYLFNYCGNKFCTQCSIYVLFDSDWNHCSILLVWFCKFFRWKANCVHLCALMKHCIIFCEVNYEVTVFNIRDCIVSSDCM